MTSVSPAEVARHRARAAPGRLHWADNRAACEGRGVSFPPRFVTRQGHLTLRALACGYQDIGYLSPSHGPGMWEAVIIMPSPSAGFVRLVLGRLEPSHYAPSGARQGRASAPDAPFVAHGRTWHDFRTPWAARRATMRLLLAAMLET